jgi:hypothetical protein
MKKYFIGIIIGLLIAAGLYFWSRASRRAYEGKRIPVSFIVQLPPDTVSKPVYVRLQAITKDSSHYWRAINDSLQAIINGSDTSESADTAFAEYFHPYQAVIDDSTSKNFITIYPLNPLPARVVHDSTHYKPLRCDTIITLPPVIDRDINVSTVASVGVGATGGAAIANVPGAAIGSIAGLIIDWIFF